MNRLLGRTHDAQHGLVAMLSIGLIATSPWVSMRRVVPEAATFWDYTHVGFGFTLALLAVAYFVANLVDGGWRHQFPWVAGDLSEVRTDLKAIARLDIPSAGGAGLFSMIQGLLLVLLLAAGLSGVGWLLVDGSRAALAWREWHILAANCFAWLLALHVVASALHLLDFLRD